MEIATLIMIILAGFFAAVVSILIWAPRKFWIKFLGAGLSFLLLAGSFFGITQLLGNPRPVEWEILKHSASDARIEWFDIAEGKWILLMLRFPNDPEPPKYYRLPYSFEYAKRLKGAADEAQKKGAELRTKLPFEFSWERREPKFYALPQPAPPPKEPPRSSPQIYNNPEREF